MLKRVSILWVFTILLPLLCGCSPREKEPKKIYYGSELYNASYVYTGEGEVLHIIPVMSKKNLSELKDIKAFSTDGSFILRSVIEDGEYEYKGYHLYRLCLFFSEIEFRERSLNVDRLELYFNDGETDTIEIKKCQIVKSPGELNTELVINGSPLRMPADMHTLPMELSAERKLTVTNIYLTNEDMKITAYPDGNGGFVGEFCEFSLANDGNTVSWIPEFEVKEDELSNYMSFSTSVVLQYTCDDGDYYSIPGIPRTIYNPFDQGWGSIESYFDYLGIK